MNRLEGLEGSPSQTRVHTSDNMIEQGRIYDMSRAVHNTIAAIVIHEKALQEASAALDLSTRSASTENRKVALTTAAEHRAVLKKFAEECTALQCDCVASGAAEQFTLEQVKEKVRALNAWASEYLNKHVDAVAAVAAVVPLESKHPPVRFSWERQLKAKLNKSRAKHERRTSTDGLDAESREVLAQYNSSMRRLALLEPLLSLEKPKLVKPLLSLETPKPQSKPQSEPLLELPSPEEPKAFPKPPGLTAATPPRLTAATPPGLTAAMPPGLTAAMPPGLTASMPPGLTAANDEHKHDGMATAFNGTGTEIIPVPVASKAFPKCPEYSPTSNKGEFKSRRGSVRCRRQSDHMLALASKMTKVMKHNRHRRIDQALMSEGNACRSLRGWYLGATYRQSFEEEEAFHAEEKKRGVGSYGGGDEVADAFDDYEVKEEELNASECKCAIQ